MAGSAYTYSYATLGELVAFIIGWDLILEYGLSIGQARIVVGYKGGRSGHDAISFANRWALAAHDPLNVVTVHRGAFEHAALIAQHLRGASLTVLSVLSVVPDTRVVPGLGESRLFEGETGRGYQESLDAVVASTAEGSR